MAVPTKRCWKLQDFVAHSSNVNCLALGHKAGRVLVTGGDDKKVNLWAVGKHNCFMSLTGHTTPIECVQFGHTDEHVCAGSQSGALKIWDLEAAKIVRTLTGHKGSIRCIDFHPYGDFLASGSLDKAIKLWDIRRKGCIFTYKGHDMKVNSLKFSPDGQWIGSGGEEGAVKLWDLRAGRMLKEFVEHGGAVTAVKFHPNEFLLASSSADRTVNLWDLDKFQLIATSEKNAGAIRCISFSENGECLFAGAQDILKVYGWEPTRTFDVVPISWGKIRDIALSQHQLIGASFHSTNVVLHIVDLNQVQPFGGLPESVSPPFAHRNSLRKSFSREQPFTSPKAKLDVKTIEESDPSGTDPEDDSHSFADIRHEGDYKEIFQPNRNLARTPPPEPEPFPAPLEDDPTIPQVMQPSSTTSAYGAPDPPVSECKETIAALPSPPPKRVLRLAYIGVQQEAKECTITTPVEHVNTAIQTVILPNIPVHIEPEPPVRTLSPVSMQPHTSSLPRSKNVRGRINSHKDSSDIDYLPKANNIHHSPSEPTLYKPGATHNRTHSLNNNIVDTANLKVHLPREKHRSSPAELHMVPVNHQNYPDKGKDPDEIVPIVNDRPVGLDLEEFLPKSYSRTLGYQQTCPDMSEAEVLSSLVRGHDSMMAVMRSRQRSLQVVYSAWKSKGVKAGIETAVAMNDSAVIVDLLGVLTNKSSIWTLDVCVALLNPIFDLIQSKYEMYMTTGCGALRLILRNFSSVIKQNVEAPIQTVGVDISREERYHKCMKCYNQLMTIRAFLLKRQTLQGKLGQTFRELLNMMKSLDCRE